MKKLFLFVMFTFSAMNFDCDSQKQDLVKINPVGYSDVEFIAPLDTVITSTIDGRIFVEINGNKKKQLLTKIDDEIYDVIFSKIHNYIFAATFQSGILVINKTTGKVVKQLPTPESWCTSLDLNADETVLAAGCVYGDVYFWDINNDFKQSRLSTRSPAFAIKFYNNDQHIVVAGYDISLWNIAQQKLIKKLKPHSTIIKGIDVDWPNKILVSCSYDKTALLINLDNYSIKHKITHPNFPFEVHGKTVDVPIQLALTSCRILNDKLITAGADRTLRIWDIETGELINTYTGHSGSISNIDISPNHKQIASVSLRGELRFWDLE